MKKLTYLLTALCFLFFQGCGGDHDHDHDHDHEHEETHDHDHEGEEEHHHDARLSLVSYSGLCEFYADAEPFVAGQESHLLLHLTTLSDFKPVVSAEGKIELIVGSKKYSTESEHLSNPGTMRFHIKPMSAGQGELLFVGKINGQEVSQSLGKVEIFADEHSAHHEADEHTPHSATGAPFSKELSWRVDFATEEVSPRQFGEVVTVMGLVEPARGESRQIVARNSGVVVMAGNGIADGQRVSAGQTLFHVDASHMADNEMQVRRAEAEAALRLAKSELERVEALAKDKLASASELAQAKKEYEVALANSKNSARFGSGNLSVTSPIAGFITALQVSNGQYVEAGQTLATVSRTNNVYVTLQLTPEQSRRLGGSVGDIAVKGSGDEIAWSVSELGGSVIGRSNSADTRTGLVPMTISFRNEPGFVGGEYVQTSVHGGGGPEVLTVPRTALIDEEGHFSVYVQLTPEYFEKREVKTGRSDGARTEIVSGLRSGERVVSRGAVMVKISQSSGKLDPHAGHVH
ncbi:MAG: efflux RND transporter periplasmic adaptor subunit [Bacteroides sp.]|nr:efflux RND transporter periplasmic adaptor subunit [Bacteroides sp.]MBD5306019.1 efflux RND transporter periplasmic adaptor subunit [Bacteroides sp.]